MNRVAPLLATAIGICIVPMATGQERVTPNVKPIAQEAHGEHATRAAKCIANLHQFEFVQMLTAVLSGSRMGPGDGWFHPSRSRYTWDWIKERFDADRDGRISRSEFRGPDDLFQRLDRDGSGSISASDLDWSDASPYWRQEQIARTLLRRADSIGDGQLTAEEWAALFAEATKNGKALDADSLRRMLFPPPQPAGPPDMPSKAVLVKGLFTAELGSPFEGPALNAAAPDFTLKTLKGDRTVTLEEFRGKKPIVLVFGSFT